VTTEISRDELHRELAGDARVTLVEALGPAYFADAHLPGAINIPPDQVDRLAPALLPDRDASIVVYCSGTCSNSEIAARRLEQLGYSAVRVYLGGKEDWVEHGLPVERTPDE
jgi:rhodanese-related sulfurtransferase